MGTATKERPIIFTGESVRAILDGRKTQTRRVVRHTKKDNIRPAMCPYGYPGEKLWVREAFDWVAGAERSPGKPEKRIEATFYRADGCRPPSGKWASPIHMPHWASRLLLEITAVRVERLHDISEADAIAEGAMSIANFAEKWREIHGGESWAANPLVWVIEFKRGT